MRQKILTTMYVGGLLFLLILSPPSQANSRFESLKQTVFSQPYTQRPTYKVTRKPFGRGGDKPNNHLRAAARRTLSNTQDLYEFEGGQKLLQANGICFAGEWRIDQDSDFTGVFQAGTSVPTIVRASVALGGVLRKNKRAFGLAVKLLPDNLGPSPSLNLFVLNSMGGVIADHTLNLPMDNQPPLGGLPRFADISTALRMKRDLEAADREQIKGRGLSDRIKPKATFRPVTHLAAYQTNNVVSPKWIRFKAKTEQRVNEDDFRDELNVDNYLDQQLVYTIEVAADHGGKKSSAEWLKIGRLVLTDSVTSKACDARLHFQHPTLDE